MDRAVLVVFLSGVLSVSISTIHGPKQLRALNGSCLYISCHFTVNKKNIVAKWFKNQTKPDNLIFTSQKQTERKVPMKLVGNLTRRNCSTVFYNLTTKDSDTYYLRLENKNEAVFKITVKESPKRPVVTILGEQHENSLVTLTCAADTPCPQAPPSLTWDVSKAPPTLTWALPPSRSQLITNSNGTFITIIQLHNLTLTHLHDRATIKCLAQYPVTGGIKTSGKKLHLNVTYAPKNTQASVSLSGGLWSSQTVSLNWSSTAHPPVQDFSWFKVSTQVAIHVYDGHLYSFNITSREHFYCVAYNRFGNQSSSVIELSPAAPLLWGLIGGGLGLLVLISLGFIFWCFLCRSKDGKQAQREAEDHYAEVNFLRLQPKSRPDTEQDQEQEAEPVYSQVRKKQLTAPTQDI